MSVKPSPHVIAFGELCLLLNRQPARTREELRERIGVCQATMVRYMRVLIARRLIYPADYIRRGTQWTARWTWGYKMFGEPKPKARTQAEYCRNYRRRKAMKK